MRKSWLHLIKTRSSKWPQWGKVWKFSKRMSSQIVEHHRHASQGQKNCWKTAAMQCYQSPSIVCCFQKFFLEYCKFLLLAAVFNNNSQINFLYTTGPITFNMFKTFKTVVELIGKCRNVFEIVFILLWLTGAVPLKTYKIIFFSLNNLNFSVITTIKFFNRRILITFYAFRLA